MDSGSHIHVEDPAFISPDTDVTALVNWFKSMVPRMAGLKDVRQNAACLSLLMMLLVV